MITTDLLRPPILRLAVRNYVGARPVEVGVSGVVKGASPGVWERLRALGYLSDDDRH